MCCDSSKIHSVQDNKQYLTTEPFPLCRGGQEEQWSRQTSLDTSYNVPSLRSEVGETEARPHTSGGRLGRFDSIAEVTESRTETEDQPWRNRGPTQQTF